MVQEDLLFGYKYPHPALTSDCVVFGLDQGALRVLLIERAGEPFSGCWALPGGFIHMDEDLEAGARRELWEETGLEGLYLQQLAAYGKPDRDPRERVVTIAWWGIVKSSRYSVEASTDARAVGWFRVDELPGLAFDHATILADALARLRSTVRQEPIAFEFLSPKFTLTRLQQFYETVLGVQLDKRNFRKKVLSYECIEELPEYETGTRYRPPQCYRFNAARYEAMKAEGGRFLI